MSAVGPQLPPYLLAKRKRQLEEEQRTDGAGAEAERSSSPDAAEKRRRVVGPALPPAPLEERPSGPSGPSERAVQENESSSDDDVGPALPPAPGQGIDYEVAAQRRMREEEAAIQEQQKKPQREEWMLVPPKQDDLARVDPTKLRNRKFNTGKGAKAPAAKSGGDNALWTETAEQKRQRLEDEVMGVKQPATSVAADARTGRGLAEDQNTAKRIQEYNDKNRNSSLYQEHKKAVPREKEDDPSKRAFDKEKDIRGGQKIGHAKRRELLTRAADFETKFAGGKFL